MNMQAISLYSAANELAPLLDEIDDDGVISDELATALAQFEGKGQAVTAYVLNSLATAYAIDEAAKKLAKRAKVFRNRAEYLKRYLLDNMKRTGVTSIIAKDNSFSAILHLERDASVLIEDENQIPGDYMAEVPASYSPDKNLIAKAIKDGFEVPGARIVKKDRLTIA